MNQQIKFDYSLVSVVIINAHKSTYKSILDSLGINSYVINDLT